MRWFVRKITWSRCARLIPEVVVRIGLRPRHKSPSFVESLSRSVRLRKIAVGQGLDYSVWRLDDKMRGRRFAEEIGLRVPDLYAVGSVHECVAMVVERGSAVVKPMRRHDSLGVLVLTSRDQGFFDHIRKRWVATSDLEDYVRDCQFDEDDLLMAEEVIFRPGSTDLPSYDWKFYCFGGEVGLVKQYDRLTQPKPLYQCRLGDFTPVNVPYLRLFRHLRSMPNSIDSDALREAAERYSLATGVAFTRIDLFEDERGPVFGEITPHPSAGFWHTNYLGRDLDRRLGEMWERAEVRLTAQSLDPTAARLDG